MIPLDLATPAKSLWKAPKHHQNQRQLTPNSSLSRPSNRVLGSPLSAEFLHPVARWDPKQNHKKKANQYENHSNTNKLTKTLRKPLKKRQNHQENHLKHQANSPKLCQNHQKSLQKSPNSDSKTDRPSVRLDREVMPTFDPRLSKTNDVVRQARRSVLVVLAVKEKCVFFSYGFSICCFVVCSISSRFCL